MIQSCSFFGSSQVHIILKSIQIEQLHELQKIPQKICLAPLSNIEIKELSPCDSCLGISDDHISFEINGILRDRIQNNWFKHSPDTSQVFWLGEGMGDIPLQNDLFDTQILNLEKSLYQTSFKDSLALNQLSIISEKYNCGVIVLPLHYLGEFHAKKPDKPFGNRKQTLSFSIWNQWENQQSLTLKWELSEHNLKEIDRDFSQKLLDPLNRILLKN